MTPLVAVVRWRLATSATSRRLAPPALGLALAFLLFGVPRQELGPAVATDAVVLFALAVWIGLAHASALAPGHRAMTQVTVGPASAFAGEVLAGLVLVAGAGAVLVGVPVASGLVPPAGPAPLAGAAVVVAAAGLAGLATAQVVDALGMRAPLRLLAGAGVVSLALARPALAEGRLPVGAVSTVMVPAVVDLARAANAGGPPGGWAAPAACTAWSAGATGLAWWLRRRRSFLVPGT